MFKKTSFKKRFYDAYIRKIPLAKVIICNWHKGFEPISIWMCLHSPFSILSHKSRYNILNLIKLQGNLVYLTQKQPMKIEL